VYSFNGGKSPEAIREDFPLLKLAQIYGMIAFYLDHQAEIDEYLARTEREFEESTIPLKQANPALWKRVGAYPRKDRRASRLSLRFQADADLKHDIVRAVRQREPGIDLEGVGDPELLDERHQVPSLGLVANAIVLAWSASEPSQWRDQVHRSALR